MSLTSRFLTKTRTMELLVQEKILTTFILKVFDYLYKMDSFMAIKPYMKYSKTRTTDTAQLIKLVSKERNISLTGLFIETTEDDIVKRNSDHSRWFTTKYYFDNKIIFLSTQWNANGNYQLTFDELNSFIQLAYGSQYKLSKEENIFSFMKLEENKQQINTKHKHWIVPADNKYFKIIDLFKERNEVDWIQKFNYTEGDIVYLYCSNTHKRILYCTEVIKTNVKVLEYINDKKYWVKESDYNEHINTPSNKYSRFRLISMLAEDDTSLSYEELQKRGLNGNIQASRIIDSNSVLLNYIKETFDKRKVERQIKLTNNPRYWIYAPGEQACKWFDCTENQIMCIAWEELGDLTKYKSREDMVKALKETYGKPNASYMHDSLALWQFVHDMKPGDVIYAKKGVKNVIGRGIVIDEYVFDEEADNYNNTRKVKWTHIGNWKISFDRQLPQKTLTRIDKNDHKFADDIEALFEKEEIKQIPFSIDSLISSIKSTNLIYSDTLIKRFTYSLFTKPFVILSGLAGSGKTQLAMAFAKAMVEDEESQLCFVSVGADWTNREPLLGFPNALQEDVYQTPESGVLQMMIEADANPTKPYFLILDEMNLSYVERYFADFLSAMEAKDMKIKLWDKDACGVPSSVSLPKNLFIVGTINVDETTYMFSPKVLDRANVIEFKVSEDDMESFLDRAPNVDMKACEGKSADMAMDFVEIAIGSKVISTDANDVLKEFFKELKTVNAEFGYRTATEIGRFISLATENDSMALNDAVDAAIVQKLLPKLHGSRKKMIDVLRPLFKLCLKDRNSAELEKVVVLDESLCKYPISADKIHRMYKIAIDNGYTSFAEA